MKKIYYNPAELPVAVRLQSSLLGVNKEYECHTGEGPVWMDELFKLAATTTFDKVEVKLSAHNEAYYRDKTTLQKVQLEGWISLKDYKNGGGYLNDKTGLLRL